MKLGHLMTAPIASFLAFLTMVATQGMTGRESSVAILLGYTITWFVLFGFAGILPYLSTEGRESALQVLRVVPGRNGDEAMPAGPLSRPEATTQTERTTQSCLRESMT